MTTTTTLAFPAQRDIPSRPRSRRWSRLTRNRIAVAGFFLLMVIGLVAVIGPFFVASPTKQNVAERFQKPSSKHWFGTDEFGRDVFSRVVNGARISITAGLASVAIGLLIGTILGLIAGYREGRIGLGI